MPSSPIHDELELYPDHPDVLHLLGIIAYQLNHLEKAKAIGLVTNTGS